MRIASLASLLGLTALAACEVDRPLAEPVDDATTRAHLERGQVFSFDADAAQIGVRVAFDRDDTFVALTVERGAVLLGADEKGTIVLEELGVDLGPVPLPADIYPGDVRLVDLRVRLPEPRPCDETMWSVDDEGAYGLVTDVELSVDGAMEIAGEAHPLATQTLTGLELDLMVLPTSDGARVELSGRSMGVAWSWAGLELSDLAFELPAEARY